jgi:putative Mg2+ transporter-C (MgtC) family protein
LLFSEELFDPFFFAVMLDIAVAVLCGGMIGLERQLRRRPAGLRVCIIVVLTTALFVALGVEATPDNDLSRVMQGIITGVGFLGGGVIFSYAGKIQGITTAALIWALAAIGMTIGFGYPVTAFCATLLFLLIVVSIGYAERRLSWLNPEYEPEKRE